MEKLLFVSRIKVFPKNLSYVFFLEKLKFFSRKLKFFNLSFFFQ